MEPPVGVVIMTVSVDGPVLVLVPSVGPGVVIVVVGWSGVSLVAPFVGVVIITLTVPDVLIVEPLLLVTKMVVVPSVGPGVVIVVVNWVAGGADDTADEETGVASQLSDSARFPLK